MLRLIPTWVRENIIVYDSGEYPGIWQNIFVTTFLSIRHFKDFHKYAQKIHLSGQNNFLH